MNKAPAKAKGTAVATLDSEMEEYAGAGRSEDTSDYAIPFLQIIQSNSPQISPDNPKYVEEAKVGMIINSVTQELYDGKEGFVTIPVCFEKVFIEWTPRDSGGGMVAIHKRSEGEALELTSVRNDKNKNILPNGNILEATAQYYVLIVSENGVDQAIVSMTSTQLKKSRAWQTMIAKVQKKLASGKVINPPSFACQYRLSTIHESNNHGDWYGWKVSHASGTQEPSFITNLEIFQAAKLFYESVKAGAVKVSEQETPEQEKTEPVM